MEEDIIFWRFMIFNGMDHNSGSNSVDIRDNIFSSRNC